MLIVNDGEESVSKAESMVEEENVDDEGEEDLEDDQTDEEEEMETEDGEMMDSEDRKFAIGAERTESRSYGSITHKCEVRHSVIL